MLESIMATVIFSMAALSLMPMLSNVGQTNRQILIREQCMKVARAKLNEYMSGQRIPVQTTGPYSLLTPLTSDWTGVAGSSAEGNASARGFYWAKIQYSRYFPRICASSVNFASLKSVQATFGTLFADQALDPASFKVTFASDERFLGVRECVASEATLNELGARAPLANMEGIVGGSGTTAGCTSNADLEVDKILPGFRMFVRMELDASFRSGAWDAGSAASGQEYDLARPELDDRCPIRLYKGVPLYDFDGAGEGIKVTVTGVVDFPGKAGVAASANDRLAGIPRSNRGQFVCSVQSTIRPEPGDVRFLLAHDGRIYRARGIDRLKAVKDSLPEGDWTFRSLYSDGGIKGISGIRAISVHPRNLGVYVLKAGALVRYSVCSSFPLDCEMDPASSVLGRSDDSTAVDIPAVQSFPVPEKYNQVFVDYARMKVYLLNSERTEIAEVRPIKFPSLSHIADPPKESVNYEVKPVLDGAGSQSVTAAQAPWLPTVRPGYVDPPLAAWLTQRLIGVSLDPSGNELMIAERTDQSWDAIEYRTSLYRVRDPYRGDPVGYLSEQVRSISH